MRQTWFQRIGWEAAADLSEMPFEFQYAEAQGAHNWQFWQEHLKPAFASLFAETHSNKRGEAL